jgi:hypothetical protein
VRVRSVMRSAVASFGCGSSTPPGCNAAFTRSARLRRPPHLQREINVCRGSSGKSRQNEVHFALASCRDAPCAQFARAVERTPDRVVADCSPLALNRPRRRLLRRNDGVNGPFVASFSVRRHSP